MRHRLTTIDVRAWIAGRWGPRRVRVEECWSILTAEHVYTRMIATGTIAVGARGEVTSTLGGRTVVVPIEVRANAVWRFGRVFLGCPMCSRLATRIYLPTSESPPGCRRCWGLTYESRKTNYRTTGPFSFCGSWAEAETVLARQRRSVATKRRYAERRLLLKANSR